LGNLVFRGGLVVAALAVELAAGLPLGRFAGGTAADLVGLHLGFNLVLAALALPLVHPTSRLVARLVPDEPQAPGCRQGPLDRWMIAEPRLALASATRELLRMGETVAEMLRPLPELLEQVSRPDTGRLCRLDDDVNWRHVEIKLFLAELKRGNPGPEDARHGTELTEFAINLEHAGDVVARTLLPIAEKKADLGLTFSAAGRAEIRALHASVMANLDLALNVLVSGDVGSARRLVRAKEHVRRLERESRRAHLDRLQSRKAESLATSNMHLETLQALKDINSLFATAAYPILSEHGELLESRLARPV